MVVAIVRCLTVARGFGQDVQDTCDGPSELRCDLAMAGERSSGSDDTIEPTVKHLVGRSRPDGTASPLATATAGYDPVERDARLRGTLCLRRRPLHGEAT